MHLKSTILQNLLKNLIIFYSHIHIMNASIQQYYIKQILYLNIKAFVLYKDINEAYRKPYDTRENYTETRSVTSRITPSLPPTFY